MLTREDVEGLPKAPFLDRKYYFDSCLGEVLDEVVESRASIRYLIDKGQKRKNALGSWYNNYVAITVQWAQIAVGYDREHRLASEDERARIETEYLNFEKANIKGILNSVDMCIASKKTRHLRERIKEIERAWCARGGQTPSHPRLRVV